MNDLLPIALVCIVGMVSAATFGAFALNLGYNSVVISSVFGIIGLVVGGFIEYWRGIRRVRRKQEKGPYETYKPTET